MEELFWYVPYRVRSENIYKVIRVNNVIYYSPGIYVYTSDYCKSWEAILERETEFTPETLAIIRKLYERAGLIDNKKNI